MDIKQFWKSVLAQDEREIRKYFHEDACVNWHCTNEHFTVDEYIIANCEYPGEWDGVVERVEIMNDLIVTVVLIYPEDRSASFHVTSFIQTKDDKIIEMDEYYADDGTAPQWRLDKHIGTSIK
ncbi:nuclear transport factor 2 family protein [Blautia sp. XA-2221]|uniref:nuclear transport factor 2 family protein n=1 Tax=Blautia sp. XA-2221 TaxID=2903961 RepID=UPI0023781F2C|nr:nuclear transport factor 2 family protein [Blautia sp. XA-2221]